MELSLSEIESRADALTLKLVHANTGRQEALQLGVQIEGLRDLAQIKATVAHQARVGVQAKLGLPMQMPWAPNQILPRETRCKSSRNGVVFGDPQRQIVLQCLLADDHPGLHTDREGVKWDNDNPAKCGVRWSWQGANVRHHEICTELAGHIGQHYNANTDTTIADNEPTKPVADRLHELVSRWQHFAESLDDAGVVEGSKDDGIMTATRVCAIELNDLLMEGGL